MSVFKKLKQRVEGHCARTTFETMTPGKKYEVFNFTQQESEFPDKKSGVKPVNLITFFKRDEFKKAFVIMPNVYNNLEQTEVNAMTDAIKNGNPPTIVFYGKDGQRNEVIIHECGEEVDQDRLSKYLKPEKDDSPAKRPRCEPCAPSVSGV